ncbi:serine hydrolase [Hyphomicrobium facile]|uniref:D-alanyl-D-alanine carboxypeptidase n=1 Tax=Hyphomicrobium facile TaxID=51670 RepID=A0A1I7N0U8_9HYPH|nr:serine hydrolase [Hyphomicrobium facile]SFV28248.1 D-alanyl-D-alanine carboxypeptidase [Hyphomicrobium facile]
MLRRALAYAPAFAVVFGVFLGGASAAGGNRHAALILDANTGTVLHDADGNALRHPASLTKMMTLYMTFETLQSGRLKMSDKLTISAAAAGVAPSKLDLKPGEQITVSDAIRAVITKSANDIAVALAEKVGGSEANFVRLMNARALEIGMSKTHFENASGLPNNAQVTTARDMATLALRLQDDFPSYYPLFATRTFAYGGKNFRNHNTMLNNFAGIDGIKTGYTRASGFNLVTSWRRGDHHLIGVVFGGDTAAERNAEMRVLLTRMASRASAQKTRKPTQFARLKSEPKAAQRPVDRKPRPTEVAETAPPAPRQQPSAAQSPEPSSAAEPETQPETPVQIFKVRAVPMVPKARPAAASPEETTDMEASDRRPDRTAPPPRGTPTKSDQVRVADNATSQNPASQNTPTEDIVLRPFAPASLGASDAEAGMPSTASPQTAGTQGAMLNTSEAKPYRAAAAIAAEAPAASPAADVKPIARTKQKNANTASHSAPVIRGLPPSTLGAQASALHLASVQGSYEPRNAGKKASGGRYTVQIGAYGSIDDAQRALTNVQGRVGKLLAGIPTVTHPAQKDGRQVYRARFTGFDADRATTTCNALRRQSVDCFVMAGD